VARKKVKHAPAPLTPAQLRDRIDRAQREGRFQQAIELSKQLHAQEPTPANHDLLLNVYLGRAQQLRSQGQPRDARIVLENVVTLAGNEPAWREKAALELAACGEVRRALQLLGDKQAVRILFSDIAPRFADRAGGYTRILKLAKPRLGDAGPRAIIEFVGIRDRAVQKAPAPKFEAAASDAE